MVEIKRNENETALSALRRFTKRLQQSGVLIEARSHQFRERTPSAYRRRKSAMFRLKQGAEFERLRKLGKLPERKKR